MAAGLRLGRLGAHLGELGDPVDHADHLLSHLAQDVVGGRAVAAAFKILKGTIGVMRERNAAAGEHRDAAGVGHFFDEQNLCAGIVGGDCRYAPSRAVADDEDVDLFVRLLVFRRGVQPFLLVDSFKMCRSPTCPSPVQVGDEGGRELERSEAVERLERFELSFFSLSSSQSACRADYATSSRRRPHTGFGHRCPRLHHRS